MLIAFTGGGTAGHVCPNLAIIEEVKKLGAKCAYIGEKGSVEERLVHVCGTAFWGIHAGKLRRYFDFRNFIDVFKIPLGIAQAIVILKKLKPDLLFSKGGYVSVPVCIAARLLKIPVWLHESDSTPGLANKICGRFARKIFLAFEETRGFFRGQNMEAVGNPVRRQIFSGDKKHGYALTGFTHEKPVILVMGGSTGALSLNNLVYEILPDLLKTAQVVHITGSHGPPRDFGSRYKSFEFLNEELAHIYAIADLAVSRAGAGGIFELLALRKPMILIPLPAQASRGDQIGNARIFAEKGFARALDQNLLAPRHLLAEIKTFLHDKKALAEMFEKQKRADFTSAALKIAEEMIRNL